MPDIYSTEKRSWLMSQVRSRNTTPEMAVRSVVHRLGFRFGMHDSGLPGKPDIVLRRYRKVIFVHGCFWHGHKGCARSKRPTSNLSFWNAKLAENARRDRRNVRLLRQAGYDVLILWECQLKNEAFLLGVLTRFLPQKTERKKNGCSKLTWREKTLGCSRD